MADKLPRGAQRAVADWLLGHPQAGNVDPWEDARGILEAVLPLIERDVQRKMARHMLTLDGLAHGWLCPACHGKPAIIPSPWGATAYRCGCGREWERTGRSPVQWALTVDSVLKAAAHGKPLPDLPAKEVGNA